MCGNKYNKCVAKSEVKKCHHGQGGQRWRIRKTSNTAFALTRKLKDDFKSTVKPTVLQRAKRFAREYTYFWPKRNKNPRAALVWRPDSTEDSTTHKRKGLQGVNLLYPFPSLFASGNCKEA